MLRGADEIVRALEEIARKDTFAGRVARRILKEGRASRLEQQRYSRALRLVRLVREGRKPACDVTPWPSLLKRLEKEGFVLRGGVCGGMIERVSVSPPLKARAVLTPDAVSAVGVFREDAFTVLSEVREMVIADALEHCARRIYEERKRGDIKKEVAYHITVGLLLGYRPCCVRVYAQRLVMRQLTRKLPEPFRRIATLLRWLWEARATGGKGKVGIVTCRRCRNLTYEEYFGRGKRGRGLLRRRSEMIGPLKQQQYTSSTSSARLTPWRHPSAGQLRGTPCRLSLA